MRAVIVVDIPDHMYNEDDPLDVIAGEARAHIDLGDVTIDDVILHRDQRFIDTLMECIKISSSKGNDYSPGEDPYGNMRGSEDYGVSAFIGALIRKADKVRRQMAFAQGTTLQNEGVRDSLLDEINYAVMALIFLSEAEALETDNDDSLSTDPPIKLIQELPQAPNLGGLYDYEHPWGGYRRNSGYRDYLASPESSEFARFGSSQTYAEAEASRKG